MRRTAWRWHSDALQVVQSVAVWRVCEALETLAFRWRLFCLFSSGFDRILFCFMSGRFTCCFAAVTRSMRDTLPTLQSTIEEHIGRHQSMVQVRAVDVLVMIQGLGDEVMIGL
jgi:hypothetical protein